MLTPIHTVFLFFLYFWQFFGFLFFSSLFVSFLPLSFLYSSFLFFPFPFFLVIFYFLFFLFFICCFVFFTLLFSSFSFLSFSCVLFCPFLFYSLLLVFSWDSFFHTKYTIQSSCPELHFPWYQWALKSSHRGLHWCLSLAINLQGAKHLTNTSGGFCKGAAVGRSKVNPVSTVWCEDFYKRLNEEAKLRLSSGVNLN